MEFIDNIIKQANANPREEICGFVIQRALNMLEAFPTANAAENREEHFQILPQELLRAKNTGNLLAVYHSHWDRPAIPSEADISNSEEIGLPFYIYSLLDQRLVCYVPSTLEKLSVVDRPYLPLVYNCMTLCIDYYEKTLGIPMTKLETDYSETFVMSRKLMDYAKSNGFVRMGDPRPGDIVVMNLNNSVPDHTGIYLEHGDLFHHLLERRSERTVYGGIWAKATCYFLRHSSLL